LKRFALVTAAALVALTGCASEPPPASARASEYLASQSAAAQPAKTNFISAKDAPVTVSGAVPEFYDANGRTWMRNGLMTEGGKGWLGPRNGGGAMWISFMTDAPYVEPVFLPLNGRVRSMVDGAWNAEAQTLPYSEGAVTSSQVVMAGPKTMRRVDIRMDEAPFGGLVVPDGYTISPAPRGNVTALNIGDSYSESNMSLPQSQQDRLEGQIYTMGRALGIEKDIINDAIGGRGYTNPGASKTFLDSIRKDLPSIPLDERPKFITIWGGYNDGKATLAELTSAAGATYAALNEQFPGVPVFVVFNGDRPEPAISATRQKDMRDAIKSAALAAPNVTAFVDGIAGTWFPGALAKRAGPSTPPEPWLTADNVGQMIGSDGVHGTPAYYQKVGPFVAKSIKDASGGELP